jgi:CRISPR-associated protein Cas4
VYEGGAEELYHATPQTRGKAAHTTIDEKKYSTLKSEIVGLSVYSDELGIAGKIDIYKAKEKLLIERKYQLKTIYQGQIYQLWAEYFCMKEMGYDIEKLAFYAISNNQMFPVELPSDDDKQEMMRFIEIFKMYNPEEDIITNENKCNNCIYNSLCDKTEYHVYE